MEDDVSTNHNTDLDVEVEGPIELDEWDPPDIEDDAPAADETAEAAFAASVDARMDLLRGLYVESGRDEVLAAQFHRLLVEKDSDVPIRRWAGLLVKAPSGAGKTRMLSRFLKAHPRIHGFGEEETNFVNIDVPSPVTNKSLGLEVLRTMYPQQRGIAPLGSNARSSSTSGLSDIWREARTMAAELDVWGLWIDEAHDLRNGGPVMLDILQASFKRWMAQEHRPILIFSGTVDVEQIFLTREFRRRFLVVESPTLSADTDILDLRRMIAKYLREAGLGADRSLQTFMPRLVHAGTRQLGWTLDVVIEAIRVALMESADNLAIEHFAESYGDIVQCPRHENPFIADDWASIDTVLHRSRQEQTPSRKPGRRKRGETPW